MRCANRESQDKNLVILLHQFTKMAGLRNLFDSILTHVYLCCSSFVVEDDHEHSHSVGLSRCVQRQLKTGRLYFTAWHLALMSWATNCLAQSQYNVLSDSLLLTCDGIESPLKLLDVQGRMQGEAWGARAPPRPWLYERIIDPIPLQLINF